MSNIQQLKCLVQITQGLIHIYFESKDCILILQLFKLRHRNIKPLAQDTPLAEGRLTAAHWLSDCKAHGLTIEKCAG